MEERSDAGSDDLVRLGLLERIGALVGAFGDFRERQQVEVGCRAIRVFAQEQSSLGEQVDVAGEFGVRGSGSGVLPCLAQILWEVSGLGCDLSGEGEVFGKLFHRRDPGVGEGNQVRLEIGDGVQVAPRLGDESVPERMVPVTVLAGVDGIAFDTPSRRPRYRQTVLINDLTSGCRDAIR